MRGTQPRPAQPASEHRPALPCASLPCPALPCLLGRGGEAGLPLSDRQRPGGCAAWRGVAWRAVLALPLPCSTLIYSTPSPAPLQPYHNRSPQQQPRRPQPAARCEHPTYGWAGLLALPRLQQC